MPSEIAWRLCRTKFGGSWAVSEEEDGQVSAVKLDPARAKLPFLCEPEPATVELDSLSQISYLDIGVNSEQANALYLCEPISRTACTTASGVSRGRKCPAIGTTRR
jgi:hypothetical protein